MSKTLFWYLLKDLLRIFLVTTGTLAGIMSFGALLKPLTQHGLDLGQVGRILSYFSPAMTTYSLPIAALFATTIVYGRLSADNELTACRASGISNLAMTWPAILLGLLVALVSLLFLSFIVPVFTLKVEKVIYSNIAQLIANKITRTHEISYGKTSIFAQSAEVRPVTADGKQVVDLYSPMIFTYTSMDAPALDDGADVLGHGKSEKGDKANKMKVPSKIWIAKRATAYIRQKGDEVYLEAVMEEASDIPRGKGGSQVSVGQGQFGPVQMGTPIRENTKFMDVAQLKQLLGNPESSKRLVATVQTFIQNEQREAYFELITRSLRDPNLKSFRMIAETETLVISGTDLDIRTRGGELVISPKIEPEGFVQIDRESYAPGETVGTQVSSDKAKQVRVTLEALDLPEGAPADSPRRMEVKVHGYDVGISVPDEDLAAHEKYPRAINMPMPDGLRELEKNNVKYYLSSANASRADRETLKYNYDKLIASIRSEMHSRASFAVSCFILVMVGCALGMISKSGNFLSAFAVSVVPALLCIALIVTGQHVCENTPKSMTMGLSLVWSGNVIVLIMAVLLLGKLQRQ